MYISARHLRANFRLTLAHRAMGPPVWQLRTVDSTLGLHASTWNSRMLAAYSNLVAVVVEQPLKIEIPLALNTSAVPSEVYSDASEFKVAS